MTQKNASMVEQTTQASRKLSGEADILMSLVRQFRLEAAASASRQRAVGVAA